VAIADDGPGIDFRTLPKATLVPGFSTAASLGMGFTIMLQLCERVLLSTRPGRTVVVLEFAAAREPALQPAGRVED
jgi:anti-sigma regulatory factor (Ser/Thr protein kinase)